jgi:hypothetical protein
MLGIPSMVSAEIAVRVQIVKDVKRGKNKCISFLGTNFETSNGTKNLKLNPWKNLLKHGTSELSKWDQNGLRFTWILPDW